MRLRVDREPRWVDLGRGVHVLIAPVRSDVMLEARTDDAVTAAVAAGASAGTLSAAMAKALARRTILEWRGVNGEDDQPLPVSPEAVDALLDVWPIFEAWNALVVGPAMGVDDEGNG